MSQQKSSPTNRKKALFDPKNVPPGGTCLSSFLIITTTGDDVLVGKMTKPEIWSERFFVGEKFAPLYASSGKYVLPASHLAWYESPLDAAYRVVTEQAELACQKENIKLIEVQSYLSGDPKNMDQPPHWDICFIYKLQLPKETVLKLPEWFQELHFVKRVELKPEEFTRGHGDILEGAALIKSH
jgi:ADP-ribose pyrophosphatase YjhB (NUDIX family)